MESDEKPFQLSEAELEKRVTDEQYHHFPGSRSTVCFLRMDNGQEFIGTAICALSKTFTPAQGRKQAKRNTLSHIVTLERYAQADRNFRQHQED